MMNTQFLLASLLLLVIANGSFAASEFYLTSELPGISQLPADMKFQLSVFAKSGNLVSDDGSSLVLGRFGASEVSPFDSYLWNAEAGIVQIEPLTGYKYNQALRISPDGTRVFGRSANPNGAAETWVWSADKGTRGLGFDNHTVNSDGTVWATTLDASYNRTNELTLHRSVGGSFERQVFIDSAMTGGWLFPLGGISGDGTKVVLYTGAKPPSGVLATPTIWSEAEGFVQLTTPVGTNTYPESVSFDGSVIVGVQYSPNWAFRWAEDTGYQWLFPGHGKGVSPDGEIVFGYSDSFVAWIWDEVHGSRELQPLLENEFGLANQLSGLTLGVVDIISANRRTIRGLAYPTGQVANRNNELEFFAFLDRPLVPFLTSPFCGDADLDQDLDSADLLTFLENWTGTLDTGVGSATFAMGDCDGDKDIDSADLLKFLEGWTGAEASNATAVPEPSFGAMPMIMTAIVLALNCRRRVNHRSVGDRDKY